LCLSNHFFEIEGDLLEIDLDPGVSWFIYGLSFPKPRQRFRGAIPCRRVLPLWP
jgi:hypothetical protein